MEEEYYFFPLKPRYTTQRVHDEIPTLYQMVMWRSIDNLLEELGIVDEYQFFYLYVEEEDGDKFQIIKHVQEDPEHTDIYAFLIDDDGITDTILAKDDRIACIMCFGCEY